MNAKQKNKGSKLDIDYLFYESERILLDKKIQIGQCQYLLITLFYTEYIANDILNNCDFRLQDLEKHKEWFDELVKTDVKAYEERIHKESCYWSDETWNDWYNFVTK